MSNSRAAENLHIGQIMESTSRIEPARLENVSEEIADLVAELSAASATLGAVLHPTTAANLASLVRVMNTYYSNLIEGHDTRPREIERALLGDFDENHERKNLQVEAAAHMRVQESVENMVQAGTLLEPASTEFILWLHREFYRDAPADFLHIRGKTSNFSMIPGRWRNASNQDVAIGRHLPPSSERVEAFMEYFAKRYCFAHIGKAGQIISLAAAHHRFNYIHPFPDGNGRVSRLMTHAMALNSGIGAHGLWSISRGLARGLTSRTDYKVMMDHADSPRQGDLDGRGNLSQQALVDFTIWFLKVALDQVQFMSSLFDLNTLELRLKKYVEQSEKLKPESFRLLQEALTRGQFERGEASRITGLPERSARRVLNDVIAEGLLASETPKSQVSLRFPAKSLDTLFPRLYQES